MRRWPGCGPGPASVSGFLRQRPSWWRKSPAACSSAALLLETVVAFWTEDATRHQFKMFKPVREVSSDDLPSAWLKDSLAVPEGFGCDCC